MPHVIFESKLFLCCCAVFILCSTATQKGVYKLPDLNVETNSTYLVRGVPTQLECRVDSSPEWTNVTLDKIHWMKDGIIVSELENEGEEISDVKGVLHIKKAAHSTEGEYQCSAILRDIRLSNNKFVDTRLVSAPVKLRRARITKFERYVSETIRVKAGEIARLPCYGIPDVVPGPADIWFEKQGNEGVQLGRTGNQRFVSTPTGLQIALTQTTDAGRYYCLVRNSFLNVTRAAPKPIVLKVDPSERYRRPPELRKPKVVYPVVKNYSEPIEVHVVEGESVILECVIADSVIRWNKQVTNDKKILQIWGNLRIKNISLSDAGLYICFGLREYDLDLNNNDHPKVIYKLIVHAPTNVRLMLSADSDKTWISCYAYNLLYEIPMLFINGLALIESMAEMGVPAQTNFYTNPINVTLKSSIPLTGSVQCISRPAMEESEVYGEDMERGRSMNLYVDEQFRESTFLAGAQEAALQSTQAPTLMQNEPTRSASFELHKPVVFMNSDNARIQWNVEASDEKLTYLKEFVVEFRQRDPRHDNSTSIWTQSERIPAHVKAVTLRRLNSNYQYQFRVMASFSNGYMEIYSSPTEWIGFVNPQTTAPFAPYIVRLQTISHSSILVGWKHETGSKLNAPESFIVSYTNTETGQIQEIKVESNIRELLLTNLDDGTEYKILVFAENSVGKSAPSKPKIIRTYVIVDDTWQILNINGTAFLVFVTLISAAIPALCFLLILFVRKFCSNRDMQTGRTPREHMSMLKEDLFNKNQLYQDPLFLQNDPFEELSPLNYSLDERENDQMDTNFVEKPFAGIRPDLQRGSQMSLNNTRNGFKRLAQRQDIDIYGASTTALNIPQPMFYNIAENHRQHLLNSASSFHPIQSPLITRSTLSVFTHPNGRQQAQKRSAAMGEIGSPFDNEQATVTTTTSPNQSSGSSPKQPPPLPTPPKTNLRAATSSMELSNGFRTQMPSNSMRTFGIDNTLSNSQLFTTGQI